MHETRHVRSTPSLKSSRALDDMDSTFRDRPHAARYLLDLGILRGESRPHLVAFTPGGLKVAREIERLSEIPLTCAPVAEFSPPWPGGPVFGAAAFDGTVVVDEELKRFCSVSRDEYHRLVEGAYERVAGLVEENEDGAAFPDLKGQTAIVVDDGRSGPLAVRSTIAAVRNSGAPRVVLGLPMGERRCVRQLSRIADMTYCASLRSGRGNLSAAYAPANLHSLVSHLARPTPGIRALR
jgi:predicted phosphoribosyltransferase